MRRYGIVPEFSFVLGCPPDPVERRGHDVRLHPPRSSASTRRPKSFSTPTRRCRSTAALYTEAQRLGFAFPETLEEWASPEWQQLSMRRGDGIPWMDATAIRRRVRNFERVHQRVLPDGHRSPAHRLAPRALLKAASAWRYALKCVRRAVRAARAAAADALPAAGDDGVLTDVHRAAAPSALAPRRCRPRGYELWAETYPPRRAQPADARRAGRSSSRCSRAMPRDARARRRHGIRPLPAAARSRPARRWSSASISRWRCWRAAPARAGACAATRAGCRSGARAFDLVNASLMVGDVADLARLVARDGARARAGRPPGLLGLPPVVGAARLEPHVPRRRDGDAARASSFNPHAIDDHLAALEHAGARACARSASRGSPARRRRPGIKAFRRRWGNPQVVVVFHAVKEP